jgi:hypothetical protein
MSGLEKSNGNLPTGTKISDEAREFNQLFEQVLNGTGAAATSRGNLEAEQASPNVVPFEQSKSPSPGRRVAGGQGWTSKLKADAAGAAAAQAKPAVPSAGEVAAAVGSKVIPTAVQPWATAPMSAAQAAALAAPFPDLEKGGRPAKTYTNTMSACVKLGIICTYDTFHNRMTVGGHPIRELAGELSDNVCHILRKMIRVQFGFDPGLENVIHALTTLCLENSFNPVRDYLDGLKWDGVPRLDTWMVHYLGAEDTTFNRTVGRLMLTAAVRRVRHPGTKFDQIVVLEGLQGTQKSTSIEVLAGTENFSDQTILGRDDRQVQELCAGVWLYEIADFAGMRKAEVEQVKSFGSRTEDRARPAYGRCMVSRPRTCVFIATTNSDDYLKDDTGNRRFWPVRTSTIDIDALRHDRDQLWAEASHYETQGVSIVLPENLWPVAAEQQEARRPFDPFQGSLEGEPGILCTNPTTGLPEHRVLTDDLFLRLGVQVKDRTDYLAKQIAGTMRRLGWEKAPGMMRVGGKRGRGFMKPAAQAAPSSVQQAPQVVPAAVQSPGQTPAQPQPPSPGVSAQGASGDTATADPELPQEVTSQSPQAGGNRPNNQRKG